MWVRSTVFHATLLVTSPNYNLVEICHDVEIAVICLVALLVLIANVIFNCVIKGKSRKTGINMCFCRNEERLPLIKHEK